METSIARKILSLFWEPSFTFKSLKGNISWTDLVIPMLIVIIATLVASIYITPIALDEYRARIENSERFTDTQKETALERIDKRADSPLRHLTTIIAVGVKWVALGAVMLFIANFLLGGEVSFNQMLASSAYVSLIDVVNSALKTPLIVSQQSTKVYTSLALFMEENQTFLFRFMSNIDIFAIWKIILFGIALAVFLDKKTSKPLVIIIIIWLLYAIVSAMLAGLSTF